MNTVSVREKYIKEGHYYILAHALTLWLQKAFDFKGVVDIDTKQAAFHGTDADDVPTEDVDNYVVFKLK